GELEFLGRADHQVKIRGYRVGLEEIALALARHPEVKAAHVLAPGEDGERRLVAYAAVGESAVDAAELRAFLEGQLPAAMVPAAFVLLPRLPLTANGKVDWRALPAADSAEAASARFVAPRTPTEKRLAELWGELLGVERVSVEQSFFDAGGHSLLAMRLVAEVSHRFGAEIPLRSFVSAPSIAAMAVAIEESAGGEAGPALPTVVPDFERRHLPFPLTEVQEAYWIGRSSSFELGNVATHVYLEYELEGLDVPRLEQALARVIARHEMLRALVLPSGEQQILADVPPYRVETLDLRTAEPTEAEAALAALRERMSHQQLPFERWPLFEVRASLLPGEKVRLHVSSDAIIRDAWSFRVVSEDLLQAYQAPQDELPPLGLSFRDYVLAEVAFRDTSTYRRSLAYWQERLETLPGAPQLPLAVAPGSIAAPRFTLRSATLPRERWQALKRRAAQAGLSPTALVLAVYGEVLAAWSRSPRFTVNLTVFNRFPVHPDVDRVVGDFTSLLLAEVDLAGGGPFEAQARALQERLWADLDHRHVSGVRVLRELARKSGAMGRAVAPVVLTSVLGFTEDEAAAAPTLPARLLFNVNQTPQVWLDHQAMEEGGALLYNWAAVEELFPAGVLEAMFAAYGRRLEELCEEASWQAPTPCLVPAEQLAVRQQVNATAAPLAALRLEELVLAQAAAHPGRPAVISRQRTLTFGELERSSRALARELLARGTRPQELVAVVMEKGW
ncbi:MAG TPA: condensation domain-containing protein, partial [Thermoanaerobaculia bacterium]|nr:condensation domain-containing protein [Thermoanaerobaculia bacterium]